MKTGTKNFIEVCLGAVGVGLLVSSIVVFAATGAGPPPDRSTPGTPVRYGRGSSYGFKCTLAGNSCMCVGRKWAVLMPDHSACGGAPSCTLIKETNCD